MKSQAFFGRFALALVLVVGLCRSFHAIPVPSGGPAVVIHSQGSTPPNGPVSKQVASGGVGTAAPSPATATPATVPATASVTAPAQTGPVATLASSPSSSPASSPPLMPASSPVSTPASSSPAAAPAANAPASPGTASAPTATMSGYVSTLDPTKYPRCGNSSPDSSPLVALSKTDMSKYSCGQCIYVCYQGQPTVCAKYQVQYTCTDCFPGNVLVNRYPKGSGEGSLVTIQSGQC